MRKLLIALTLLPSLALASGLTGSGITGLPDNVTVPGTLSVTGASTLTGAVTAGTITSSGNFTVQKNDAKLTLDDNASTADNQIWDFRAISDALYGRVVNDSGGAVSNWLQVDRTGVVVDQVKLFGTNTLVEQKLSIGTALSLTPTTMTDTRACASGFFRSAWNYCVYNGAVTGTSLTRDTCTPVTVPAGSKVISIRLMARASAANSVSLRSATVTVFLESSCTNALATTEALASENPATTSGWYLSQDIDTVLVPTNLGVGGSVWIRLSDDTGNQGVGNYWISGYFN